ncbi:hypothetical protein Y036_642 [Burkholderia pseudomallei]|uniref:Uncharacterized protein n=1 Tax=Burkholderia pseudomallei TaxID=28450 RepID=A0AA40JAK1_BURPE|nr:hypothetical protein [Burkholderia pseudomallei]KGX06715.1 hypothetical protein Y036_642 [Burkholderia pseudomallei]
MMMMKITDDMLTESPVDALAPRVESIIKDTMKRFSGIGKASLAAYYEEVHQYLAPLARQLERENGELRADIDRLTAIIRDQFAARRTIPNRDAIIEECAKVCDEQADFYERLNPKSGQGSYMGKLAVSRQRDCARLIRALKTTPTSDNGTS